MIAVVLYCSHSKVAVYIFQKLKDEFVGVIGAFRQ